MAPRDEELMARACRLALLGLGKTRPNPMVGAVLVKHGMIIGKGYHKKPGTAHAEVIAIQSATSNPKGSSLYVNLEPCCHFGRTPPCVDFIISKGIKKVVVGTLDPNPLMNGKSLQKLREHGVKVECGVLEDRCKKINEVFLKYIQTRMPFVILKAAVTLDGKIASSSLKSKWISSEKSRKRVHRLRSLVDAVAVGIGTVIQDDPQLTSRDVKNASNPLRVVMDSHLRISLNANVVQQINGTRTLLATTEYAPHTRIRTVQEKGIEVKVFEADSEGRVPIDALLNYLGERGIQSVLLEGGSRVFTNALEKGLVDKVMLFVAPRLLGGEKAPGFFEGKGFDSLSDSIVVEDVLIQKSGPDILLQGYVRKTGKPIT